MRAQAILGGLASIVVFAALAAAQPSGDATGPQATPPAQPPAGSWREELLPLLADILRVQTQLGLSPVQAETIERLTVDFARETIRRQADLLIAYADNLLAALGR